MASLGEHFPRLLNYSGMVNEKAARICVHTRKAKTRLVREKSSVYVVQLMGRTIRRLADQMDGDILATRTDATKRLDHKNKNSTAQIKALRKEGCYTVEEQWNVLSMRSCNEGE